MKLTNVHYEYRGNDIWRIYFKDYSQADAFRKERTDGQKAQIAMLLPIFTNGKGVRYCVEAKLTGQFNILRRYVKTSTNDYFSNDIWRALVKKIEGADSDYIFDEIDLWYDATIDKCYFRICCMNGTWTDFFVKNMLNSQFGTMAQANGYSDTDTAYQGGLCTRRSCCGIGFGQHRDKYGQTEERIIFTVKNFCRGEADIVKVSPWTNTFIGTNKENEREYSWVDFEKYMGLLSASGSDIWDIEWEYDETCPMTGTEVADKLHVYLKPEAYKRLFEEEKEGKKVWLSTGSLWSNGDYLARVQALTPPPVPYWVKLDEDSKIGFRQKEIDEMTKKIYEKLEIKQVKDFDTDTAWHEYLTATEMARLGADFDGDTVCEYCKRDVDICKEMLSATETAQTYGNLVEPIAFINHKPCTLTEFIKESKEKEANNKEEKNMGPKDTTFAEFCRKIYWGTITPVKPTKILIQGTATIIWWSDGTKTIVKCQKGDKMDPEKGIAMCVMKKFMGTNETHSNYLDFAKDAIAEYEKQQAAEKAKKKAEADKRRRAAAKKKGTAGNANYKRGAKAKTEAESKEES